MYCPNCGQQQISDEMRFCSRCGLPLSGLAEWLAGGHLPAHPMDERQNLATSPRRTGMRRAAKLMFFSGVLFPVFLVLCLAIDEGAPMIFPFFVLFVSLVWMLYARLFSDPSPRLDNQSVQTSALGSIPSRSSLSPPTTTSVTGVGRHHVRTNELAQPSSVTEHTTRLLDNE